MASVLVIAVPLWLATMIVALIHVLGHFIVGRWCGFSVPVLSIGFGPEIVGFTDRKGTHWKLSWIPLGSYVRFLGLHNPLWQRALIVAAGPIANFLLALAVYTLVFATFGRPITIPRVDTIAPGSAAEAAGFRVGDVILSINGSPIEAFSDMQQVVSSSPGRSLTFEVARDERQLRLTATPKRSEIRDRFGNVHQVGELGISRTFTFGEMEVKRYDPLSALRPAVKEAYLVTLLILDRIRAERTSVAQVSGLIYTTHASSSILSSTVRPFLYFVAALSISVGLLNLVPIPLADGGRLLLFAMESLLGRPLSIRVQWIVLGISLATVVLLFLYAR